MKRPLVILIAVASLTRAAEADRMPETLIQPTVDQAGLLQVVDEFALSFCAASSGSAPKYTTAAASILEAIAEAFGPKEFSSAQDCLRSTDNDCWEGIPQDLEDLEDVPGGYEQLTRVFYWGIATPRRQAFTVGALGRTLRNCSPRARRQLGFVLAELRLALAEVVWAAKDCTPEGADDFESETSAFVYTLCCSTPITLSGLHTHLQTLRAAAF